MQADPAALQLLARRAAGSMRDSQSLLEQLLSFGGETITEQDVHAMLGTAQSGRLSSLVRRLSERDAAGALAELDAAVAEGVDVGQLAEQLLGYLRDMMAAAVGCPPDLMLYAAAAEHGQLSEDGRSIGLPTLLAAVQILDQSITRMRQSTQVRTLVEIAIVRICNLEDLAELSDLITQLQEPAANTAPAVRAPRTAPPQKKTTELAAQPKTAPEPVPVERSQASGGEVLQTAADPQPEVAWSEDVATRQWLDALAEIGGMTQDFAGDYESLAISGPNTLAVTLKGDYNKEWLERPEVRQKLEQSLAKVAGRSLRVEFRVKAQTTKPAASPPVTAQNRVQMMREVEQHPMVQQAAELFGAEVIRVQEKRS
jgi:DNA polymerase-3 subunit gamma/tau